MPAILHVHVRDDAEVEVSEDGQLWRHVTIEQFQSELEPLQGVEDAFVAYSRASPTTEATDDMMSVLKTVADARIPIRFVVFKGSLAPADEAGDDDEAEPDGELSYVNCLLLTLAKERTGPVTIRPGHPLPNLVKLTNDPEELEWARKLPFNYNTLNAALVIQVILHNTPFSLSGLFTGVRYLKARMVDTTDMTTFKITKIKALGGVTLLEIEVVDS